MVAEVLHLDLNPAAVAVFALVAVILACWAVEPWWTKRRRRARVIAERHARVAEDEAWANRCEHADVALRLRWEHHVSIAADAREEFALEGHGA